jgi:hypothetical protein
MAERFCDVCSPVHGSQAHPRNDRVGGGLLHDGGLHSGTGVRSDSGQHHNSAGPDYAAMKETIEDRIASGSLNLSTIDAVLVSVGGGTKIAHYRNGRKSSPSAPCPRKTRRNRHVAVDQ